MWALSGPRLWARLSLFLGVAGLNGHWEGWEWVALGLVEWDTFSMQHCLPGCQVQDTRYLNGLCLPPRKRW